MMKLLKRRILSRKGFTYVVLSVLMIVILLIGVAVFEIIRINIQAGAVRDKFEDAIISMCVNNYKQMYQPIRESYAASWAFSGSGDWIENNGANDQYIRSYLLSAMNAGEIMQCDIVSIDYAVQPAQLAPSDPDSAQKYSIAGTIKIQIPYRFAWDSLPPISLTLDVKSQWRAMF